MLEAAGTATTGGGGSSLIVLLPLLLIGFLFLSQRRKQRDALARQKSIQVGDEVRTTSGLFGTVAALDETVATLEVSPGIRMRFDRRAISGPAGAGLAGGTPTESAVHHSTEVGEVGAVGAVGDTTPLQDTGDSGTSFGGATAVSPAAVPPAAVPPASGR